jgi:frataxin-like iron-binding protein CyaY
LKGYASTWWRKVRQEEGKTHGSTWEFFKECIELEFIPKNSDYISRYKLRDILNMTNDNLRQYVRAYSKLMLEIWHMHELNRVCHFVMGLPTWAKCKLEENWPTSLSEAIMKVEGFSDARRGEKFGFKKENKFHHKKARHEGEWN